MKYNKTRKVLSKPEAGARDVMFKFLCTNLSCKQSSFKNVLFVNDIVALKFIKDLVGTSKLQDTPYPAPPQTYI